MKLSILVKPNSRSNEVVIDPSGVIQMKIKAPPAEGKANEALIEFLSDILDIPKSKISILRGAASRHKQVSIEAEENVVMKKLSEAVKQK